MKKIFGRVTSFLAAVVFVTAGNAVVAQNSHEIRALGLFPMGDFGRVGQTREMVSNNQIGSGAAIGAGLGYRYSSPIATGITLLVGADFLWNNTNSDYHRLCWETKWKIESGGELIEVERHESSPNYFNLPISIGVGVTNYFTERKQLSWFFNATAGLNIHFTTPAGWKNFEVVYKPAFSAALTAELGVSYKKLSLAFSLMSLGSPTMRISSGEETYCQFKADGQKRSIMMSGVVLSYKISKPKKEWKPSRKTNLEM